VGVSLFPRTVCLATRHAESIRKYKHGYAWRHSQVLRHIICADT